LSRYSNRSTQVTALETLLADISDAVKLRTAELMNSTDPVGLYAISYLYMGELVVLQSVIGEVAKTFAL